MIRIFKHVSFSNIKVRPFLGLFWIFLEFSEPYYGKAGAHTFRHPSLGNFHCRPWQPTARSQRFSLSPTRVVVFACRRKLCKKTFDLFHHYPILLESFLEIVSLGVYFSFLLASWLSSRIFRCPHSNLLSAQSALRNRSFG